MGLSAKWSLPAQRDSAAFQWTRPDTRLGLNMASEAGLKAEEYSKEGIIVWLCLTMSQCGNQAHLISVQRENLNSAGGQLYFFCLAKKIYVRMFPFLQFYY